MLGWLTSRVRSVLDGFLLVPGLVALALVAGAVGLVRADRALGSDAAGFLFDGDASAARGILETIAGSLITVAGLAFSLTIVVLALVSSQFSPRAVPGFLADRLNQVIAGAFVGIFGYCLVILRSVRGESTGTAEAFIPRLGVTGAIALALVGLALLLVFINHMGTSIQASRLAARIATSTGDEIARLHPAGASREERPAHHPLAAPPSGGSATVTPVRSGYVRAVPIGALLAIVDGPGVRLQVNVRAGDFVAATTPIAEVWPSSALTDEARRAIRGCIALGRERSIHDDVLYGLRQLADIAVKALSPGINDPTTAVDCVGRLRVLLEGLAARDLPARVGVEGPGGATLTARRTTFEEYLAEAFDEIGRYATDNARVVVSLLDALGAIAQAGGDGPHSHQRVSLVVEVADAVARPALEDARTPRDMALIEEASAWMASPA